MLLAAYEKDKAAASALLTDFRAVAAAGLRSSPRAPVQGTQARQAVRLADAALQRLGAQVNPKVAHRLNNETTRNHSGACGTPEGFLVWGIALV